MGNIESVVDVGEDETFDVEVDHPDHQFYLANGVLTSNSHAVAYAIDSYYCAWLLTHHESEWLCSCLENAGSNAEKKSKLVGAIRAMGYQIVPIDVNHADRTWKSLDGKKLMPSFLSCSGCGEAAVEEILANRPYKSIEDMLWTEDGSWRLSKFNKRVLEALVCIGAFGSLDCVGEGKTFATMKQMHHVLIEHNTEIKKTSRRDPLVGKKKFYELVQQTRDIPEWTTKEIVELHTEYLGSFDAGQLIPPDLMQALAEREVAAIDSLEDQKSGICWFIPVSATLKKSKSGKTYVLAEVIGNGDKKKKLFVWGAKDENEVSLLEPYVSTVEVGDFGLSTNVWKLKKLNV